MSVHTNNLCAATINRALENLNDFTQPVLLFLGLALEERQFPWWVEEPAAVMVTAALDEE